MILLAALAALSGGGDPSVVPIPIGPGAALPAGRDRPRRQPRRRASAAGRRARRSASTSSSSRTKLVVVVPPGIGVAKSGCVYPARTLLPTGVVEVARGREAHARRPLPRSGAARSGRTGCSRSARSSRCARTSRASAYAGAGGRDPADAERADRGRDRRLRPAARDLPLPAKEVAVIRRLAPLGARRARARRLRRRLVRAELPDDRRGAHVRARRLRAGRRRSSRASRPTISFVIRQPDGQPLTKFKRGAGPHTGVHLIFVRRRPRDDHPQAPAGRGRRDDPRDAHVPGLRPLPARRRRLPGERRSSRTSSSSARSASPARRSPQPLPPPAQVVESGGYRFAIQGKPKLKAIQATAAHHRRHRRAGQAGRVHAVLRRARPRDLLPQGLARLLPHPRLRARRERLHERRSAARRSSAPRRSPGRLTVGVLVPAPGTWRLFLQTQDRRPRGDGAVHPRRQVKGAHRETPSSPRRRRRRRARRRRGGIRLRARARSARRSRSRRPARCSRSPSRPRRRTRARRRSC